MIEVDHEVCIRLDTWQDRELLTQAIKTSMYMLSAQGQISTSELMKLSDIVEKLK